MPEISNFIVAVCENSITKRILRFVNRLFFFKRDIKVRLYGQTIYASTLDRIAVLYLKKFSLVETFETELLKSIIKRGMTFVDIGANLGWYALIASKLIGEEGKAFAFEPDQENFRLLSKNISANDCRNIQIVNKAVSDKTGQGQLFLCEENRGDHRIYNPDNKRRSIGVSTTSLDDFFKESSNVDVIKIDVQGAENMVFKGMDGIIKNSKSLFIMLEFYPKFLEMCGFNPKDFLKTIKDYNFLVYLINEDEKKLDPIDSQELMDKYLNKSVNLFLTKTKI